MQTPTSASFQLMENSAKSVVATVRTLLTMLVSVPLTTLDTPEMSLFMRVMMSPCFSVVKKLCAMYCRCRYISLRMSNMMRWLIHALT